MRITRKGQVHPSIREVGEAIAKDHYASLKENKPKLPELNLRSPAEALKVLTNKWRKDIHKRQEPQGASGP